MMKPLKPTNFKSRFEKNEADLILWNRLIWQQALDQALKKQRDKNTNSSSKPQ